MRKRLIIIGVISLIAFLLFPLSQNWKRDKSDVFRVSKGVLDLSGWNPERDKRIALDGEWEFYWGQLLSPEHFSEADDNSPKPEYMEVPSNWNGKPASGHILPAHGSATYRVKLLHLPSDGLYALKKTNIRFASTVYVNGHKLFEDGRTSMDAESFRIGNVPQFGSFAVEGGVIEIIVQVSNYNYLNAGIPASIYFGEYTSMLDYQQKSIAREFVFLAILGTLSLIYLFCFIATVMYRSKDYSLLVFSVVCLLFAIYNGLMGERSMFLFLGNVSFETMYRMKDIVSLVSFMVLTVVFYRLQKNIISLRIAQAFSVVLGAFCLLVAFLPMQTYIPLYTYVIAVYQLLMVWLMIRVGLIYIRSSGNRLKTLLVYMAMMCVNLYSLDIILFAFSYKDSFWLGHIFLVVFNMLLVILVVMRFFEAYLTVEVMKNQLLLSDKIKDDFLSNTSHELKTPLNAIVNIADTLLKGAAGPIGEEQAKNLSIIVGSGRRLTYLVNELLDYSKMKHGDIVLSRGSVELKAAVDAVIRMHQFLLEGKPLLIVNNVPDGFPSVFADVNRLTQILHNLIGNAIKFTDSGTVKITSRVIGDKAEIRVADTGPGIETQMHERIFQPFEQLAASQSGYRGGSGLGLSITKNLVELQGGEIRVESVPGSGSVFAFTLPLADLSHREAAAETEDIVSPREEGGSNAPFYPIYVKGAMNESILVVDDDYANLQTMMNLLRLEGYTFTVVNSGRAALEEVARFPVYSLVILDIMMPDISGYEVLRHLRERFSPFELPILMLTARNRSDDVKLSLENGANDIVGKPFEAEELVARVQSLTRLKSSVRYARNAEISFLRSQIKPHFLYNALNAIAELCVDEPRQAEQLTIELSRYLRKSFDFKQLDSYTTLASELELVQAYVRIEQARFGSRLQVEYDVDADDSIRIPPLILQPLVENAIRHGLMSILKGGKVKISAKMSGDGMLMLAIADNGCGMSEQKLREVLRQEAESRGVGLWNIRKHLKLLYGTDVHIETAPGEGTKVSFHIPLSGGEAQPC